MEMSAESPIVMLPTRTPTVSTAFRLPAVPLPVLHLTDVSASHEDRSHMVDFVLAHDVKVCRPIEAPTKVILADPEDCLFCLVTMLTDFELKENPSLLLPTPKPAVMISR
jgi:hypothetical protein